MKGIKLGSRSINLQSHPYIIAEIGVNHGGSIDLAYKMIDEAKKSGADAKFIRLSGVINEQMPIKISKKIIYTWLDILCQ